MKKMFNITRILKGYEGLDNNNVEKENKIIINKISN